MNVEKELAKHVKALNTLNTKFYRKFKSAYDNAINAKASNIMAMDRLALNNAELDSQMRELETAMAITDLSN